MPIQKLFSPVSASPWNLPETTLKCFGGTPYFVMSAYATFFTVMTS